MTDADDIDWGSLLSGNPRTYGELTQDLSKSDLFQVDISDAEKLINDAINAGYVEEKHEGQFGRLYPANEPVDDDLNENACENDGSSDAARKHSISSWEEAEFNNPSSRVWPVEWKSQSRWMTRVGKQPFAPWSDRNNSKVTCTASDHDAETCDECECDARWKWSNANLWRGFDEAFEWSKKHPKTDGVVALIDTPEGEYTETGDEYAFIDGDDVRCPQDGSVHPKFVELLDKLGISYADVSTSGTGVHVLYEGILPNGLNKAEFELDTEPWGKNDVNPSVEIYDQKHVSVVTGNHIPGTGTQISEWDATALEDILIDQLGVDAVSNNTGYDTDTETPDIDLDNYEPSATSRTEKTSDIRDIYAAIDRLSADDLGLSNFRTGQDSTGWSTWNPSPYRNSRSNASIHSPNEQLFHDHKSKETFGALGYFAAAHPDIDCEKPWRLDGSAWWNAIEKARDRGADIPEYIDTADPENRIKTCEPPLVEREILNTEKRWETMQSDRYEDFLDSDEPTIWGDEAGTGKTTNAAIAAHKRDRPHAVLFQQHSKASEFLGDDATPTAEEYYHILGAEQKRHECCRKAAWDDKVRCPQHGHSLSQSEHMCPVYDLNQDDDIRQLYHYLENNLGPIESHVRLRDVLPDHDDAGCKWEQQFDDLDDAPYVVGVHEYLQLDSVTEEHDVIIDESPSTLQSQRIINVADLTRFKNTAAALADRPKTEDVHEEIARFTGDIIDALTGPDSPDSLDSLEPPAIPEPYRLDVEEYERENELDQRAKTPHPAENLARAKLEYCETMLERVDQATNDFSDPDDNSETEFDFAPMLHDAIFAAAVEAGLDEDIGLGAAAAPETLITCPRCGEDLGAKEGQRVCNNDNCRWAENSDSIIPYLKHAKKARRTAYLSSKDRSSLLNSDRSGLVTRVRPHPDSLPQAPLILNATASPDKVAAIWEVKSDEVLINGDAPIQANMNVTQVIDGQFHPGTVDDSESLKQRLQKATNNLLSQHDNPLVVGPHEAVKSSTSWLDTGQETETLHFHAARGFNRNQCDAVIIIGAPHPPINELQREAELLAVQNDDVRVGGTEHGPRDGARSPPIWRKLDYIDHRGRGRAIQTKTYSGLVGTLFQEHREDELQQIVHRVRPVLADDVKNVYMLTNVPTEIPVDNLLTLDQLVNGARATVNIPGPAIDLLTLVHDAAMGNIPDVEPGALIQEAGGDPIFDGDDSVNVVKMTRRELHSLATMPAVEGIGKKHELDLNLNDLNVSYKTISRWVAAFQQFGLAEIGEYEHRKGEVITFDVSTLTSAQKVLSNSADVKVDKLDKIDRALQDSPSKDVWQLIARNLTG